MYRDDINAARSALEERGFNVVEKAALPPRLIKTTYYRYGENPSPASVVKSTYSKWVDFAARNAFYALSQNKYEAGTVEIIDMGNYDELCTIMLRDVQGNINTVFRRNPKRPVLTTNI